MSIYMSRLFPKANSSFSLCSGVALKAGVSRVREDSFLVDSGIGSPRFCKSDELTESRGNQPTRFEDLVGFQGTVHRDTILKKRILERTFIDLVAGETLMKEQAAAKVNDLIGSVESVPGEPLIYLPKNYRQERAWMELNKCWRINKKVRGIVLSRTRGGCLVGISGFITFLQYRPLLRSRLSNDQFTIESINAKRKRVVVI